MSLFLIYVIEEVIRGILVKFVFILGKAGGGLVMFIEVLNIKDKIYNGLSSVWFE